MPKKSLLKFVVDGEGNCLFSSNKELEINAVSRIVANIVKDFEEFAYKLEKITNRETYPQDGWIFIGKDVIVVGKNGGFQVEVFGKR